MSTLQKLVDIEIGSNSYRLAENGEHFHLTKRAPDPDPFGTQYFIKVEARNLASEDGVTALVDGLGAAHKEIISLKAELSKAHEALQRESEPARAKPKPSLRETAPVAGLLEGNQG